MPDRRVVHVTLERSGSQWVKDVLTHRDVLGPSGLSYCKVTGSLSSLRELEIPANTFAGPIYNMNQWEWRYWRKPGDMALVVIRDPRDIVVSMMFAWLYSHPLDAFIQIVRPLLAGLADNGKRLTYVMGANAPYQRMMWSWSGDLDATSLLVRYEDLVADPLGGFQRVLDWLGWNVKPELLPAALDEFSFKSRVGREMGQEDVFSHQRRGLPGDWRNHFTREHGRQWETLYPGLLRTSGYETSDDWWRALPEPVQSDSTSSSTSESDVLRLRNAYLEREIEDKEKMIRELASQCEQRLATIDEKQRMIERLSNVCDERLAVMQANGRAAARSLSGRLGRLRKMLTLNREAERPGNSEWDPSSKGGRL